jgi:hypothetical protein
VITTSTTPVHRAYRHENDARLSLLLGLPHGFKSQPLGGLTSFTAASSQRWDMLRAWPLSQNTYLIALADGSGWTDRELARMPRFRADYYCEPDDPHP